VQGDGVGEMGEGWGRGNCFVGFALPPISKETAIDEWATLFFRNAFATI
jgi:hypothetical protein